MPLELLEYRVFKQTALQSAPGGSEIDVPTVPVDQTWRCSRLSVGVFSFTGTQFSLAVPPTVQVFDTPQPGATSLPAAETQLTPMMINGTVAGIVVPGGSAAVNNSWLDVDDDPGLTILPGFALGRPVLFAMDRGRVAIVLRPGGVFRVPGSRRPAATDRRREPGPQIPTAI